MKHFFKEMWFVCLVVGICTFAIVFLLCLLAIKTSTPVAERTHTKCLGGFEYYTWTFRAQYGIGTSAAPKWDRDGKPKRCQSEKEKP